jgi:transposase InsO family protein
MKKKSMILAVLRNAFSSDDMAFAVEEEEVSETSSEDDVEEYKQLVTSEGVIMIRNKKTGEDELFRVLFDSGTNRSLGTRSAVKRAGLAVKENRRAHRYRTAQGWFTTKTRAVIRTHSILELSSRRQLQKARVQVTEKLGFYDFIFGRDYLTRYGIDLRFSSKTIEWDGMVMPMRVPGYWDNNKLKNIAITIGESEELSEFIDATYLQEIQDAKYQRYNISELAAKQCHLTKEQQQNLEAVLKRYEQSFSGGLGEWPEQEVDVQLKKEAQPYHCRRPFRIPHAYIGTVQKEVERLIEIGVLEKVDGSTAGPWCAPSFVIPKKDGTVRFITDFRELNKAIERRPWPIPHIADLIQDIGHYRYVTALDLSMGYYHFRLSEQLSNLCTFMLPFGLFKYRRLPMGLSISPDWFQERMTELFQDLPFVKCYLDDILIFSDGTFEDHMAKLSVVLERLQQKGLQVNGSKSFWAVKEVEYLGFILTPNGVKPQPKKVEAIRRLARPRTIRELRKFIGFVNFYRYMWRRRSHILEPLTRIVGQPRFTWTTEQQQAFEDIKRAISKEVLLSFPDYNLPFELETDASDKQLGAVLRQGEKILAFYSKKLNKAQRNYSAGEKEMLSIVEALREFRTMIFGYPIHIRTDHKNWTMETKQYKNVRIMRWRLAIEEFMPTINYIQGENNVIADALSRLPIEVDDDEENELFEQRAESERFVVPVTFRQIAEAQAKDKFLQRLKAETADRLGELFEDIGKKDGADRVVTIKSPTDGIERVIVPEKLRARLLEWYHTILVHPGETRLYNTLHQHYTWPTLRKDIANYVKHCDACQRGKRGMRGMGKIPMKDVETEPWKDIALDLAGPWKAMIDNKETQFHSLTIIDTFTSWVEIIPIQTKESKYIRSLVEQEWLRRYPRPSRMLYDQGGEFDNQWFQTLARKWHFKPEPITVRNPRANAIVERLHRIMGDMLRVQLTTRHELDDPIREILSAAAYGIRATVHGTTQYTPAQLVFSKDMILRTTMEANMELVRQRRLTAIQRNNTRENKRRIAYDYKPGDKVLILAGGMDPKLKLHQGPYAVLSYNKSNGILHISRNNYVEPINVRLVRPYFGTIRGGD